MNDYPLWQKCAWEPLLGKFLVTEFWDYGPHYKYEQLNCVVDGVSVPMGIINFYGSGSECEAVKTLGTWYRAYETLNPCGQFSFYHFPDGVRETVDKLGLRLSRDNTAVDAAVEKAILENPDVVEKIKGGNLKFVSYLVGSCLKSDKSLDPKMVKEALDSKFK
jgi:hypothetical protein